MYKLKSVSVAFALAFAACPGPQAWAQSLTQQTTNNTTIWQLAWGRTPTTDVQNCGGSVHSTMMLDAIDENSVEIHDIELNTKPDRDPHIEAVTIVKSGKFDRGTTIHLAAIAPDDDTLKARDLADCQYYVVSGVIQVSGLHSRNLVAFETRLIYFDGTSSTILTPISLEVSAANGAAHAAWSAAASLQQVAQSAQVQPAQPAQTGTVLCYCPQCYLDCLDAMDCDGTYDTCIALCDSIHTTCMAGAQTVYDCCIGSCNCAGTPGIWCTARCYVCFLNQGTEQGICWVARIGCLTGCELAKTACYAGCYAGSWISYPNPPGCP